MKINITKKEYRLLLDMLCIADWILESFSENGLNYPEHQSLKTRLFSLYQDMEAEDYIGYDKALNDYFETQDYEEQILTQFIEPFEQTLFWDELIHRLAIRDLIHEIGKEALNRMDLIERVKQIDALEQKYAQEFEKNGLDKLVIK